jgi:catechol 2,3-dioxygenase-like lactoylglutathione lyase family enzyme
MPIELNHTIVHAHDKHASARFLADVLGVPVGPEAGPFVMVQLANNVTLDFMDAESVRPQHYAFLVTEDEFDTAYGRLLDTGADRWADPDRTRPGEINNRDGGRGVYFADPDGHFMEMLTVAYDPENGKAP